MTLGRVMREALGASTPPIARSFPQAVVATAARTRATTSFRCTTMTSKNNGRRPVVRWHVRRACFTEPDPALQPTCESGVCGYIDLYDPAMDFTSEFTECTESDECVLRVVDCCPCGAEIRMDRLVAIRVDKLADFAELVCEPGTACDDCEPSYDPFFARCGADAPGMAARCRVDVVGP